MHSTAYPPEIVKVRPSSGGFKKAFGYTVLGVFLTFGLLVYIGSQLESPDEQADGGSNEISASIGSSTSTPASVSTEPSSTPAPTSEQNKRLLSNVGDIVETKYFKVTLEDVSNPEGTDFNSPKDGKVFIKIGLVIENISDREVTVSSMLMFDAYQDGFVISESISAIVASGGETLNGTVAPGKKLRGSLSYEVDTDWNEIEVDVDLTALRFSSDGEIKIALKNQ